MFPSDTNLNNLNNTHHRAPGSHESSRPTQWPTASLPIATPKAAPPVSPSAPLSSANNAAISPSIIPGARFTSDELAKLVALRENYASHVEVQERLFDELRLEFARWLVEHGKLNEE